MARAALNTCLDHPDMRLKRTEVGASAQLRTSSLNDCWLEDSEVAPALPCLRLSLSMFRAFAATGSLPAKDVRPLVLVGPADRAAGATAIMTVTRSTAL